MKAHEFINQLTSEKIPLTWPGHRIAGEWCLEKGPLKPSISPNTAEVLMMMAPLPMNHAALSANKVQSQCFELGPLEVKGFIQKISSFIQEHKDPLNLCLRMELGKTDAEAKNEIEITTAFLNHIQKTPQLEPNSLNIFNETTQFTCDPAGCVLAHIALPTPILSFCQTVVSCLFSRCPCIIYIPLKAGVVGSLLAMMDDSITWPKGFLNVVFGDFASFKKHVNLDTIQCVSYAGSFDRCKEIHQDFRGHFHKKLSLKSGGKNSVLVHSSANLENAVNGILEGLTTFAGQLYSSTSQVFVYGALLEEIKKILIKKVSLLTPSPTHLKQSTSTMGPVLSEKALQKFLRFQTIAAREAQTWTWGQHVTTSNGFFVTPGVHFFEKYDPTSSFQSSIPFTPALSVYSYDVLDEVIQNINSTPSGQVLSFYGDPEILKSRRSLFQTPCLLMNKPTTHIEKIFPIPMSTTATPFGLEFARIKLTNF